MKYTHKDVNMKADLTQALSEHQHQARLFLLIDHISKTHEHKAGELQDVWATPNGGHRTPAVAGKLKAEGVRRGVPDISCMVPRGAYHGLFIELKKERGTASSEQRARLCRLTQRGYAAHCIQGWVDAGKTLCTYLGIGWDDRWVDLIEWHATGGRRKGRRMRRAGVRK